MKKSVATALFNRVRGGQEIPRSKSDGSNPSPSPYKSTLEQKFARQLEFDRLQGIIAGFHYEHFHLRLPGAKNFYKPDFFVWGKAHADKPIFYEIKGWSRSNDRSLVKLKVAAAMNPWAKFIQVEWKRGTWVEREF